MRPIALTIAGSDPSGGAGIQADLKTFTALGVYGASVITALTAQNTRGVQGVLPTPEAFVAQQLDSIFDDLDVCAVKIGMLATPEVIRTVHDALVRARPAHCVLDPVMFAQSGHRLVEDAAARALQNELLPLATLVTPNLPELAHLLGAAEARSEVEAVAQGRALLERGASAVLVKGGHAQGSESVDFLVTPGDVARFAAARIATRNTHGTGCTLSSAIAANLALGRSLEDAVHRAKDWLTQAIESGTRLRVGHGAGPVDHLHALGSSK